MPQPFNTDEEWCHWHAALERRWSQDLRFCSSCGHTFRTEWELLHEAQLRGSTVVFSDEITDCPRCGEPFDARGLQTG